MRRHKSWLTSLPAGLALWLGFTLFRLLPLDIASALGGLIGRSIGPRLKWHRIATANLRHALPERTEEHAAILRGMWDNLGRTLAEYPWLHTGTMSTRIQMSGASAAILRGGNGAVFAAGHLANWEIAPLTSYLHDQPLALIYRHVSNPVVERMIHRIRSRYSAALYPKGMRGARESMRALKEGQAIGLLVDQRMNDGIALTFFGRPAMTASATAELALRYRIPLLLARVTRLGGTHFHFEIEETPVSEDAATTMQTLNDRLESWIREHPEQWLWIHRRWGKVE